MQNILTHATGLAESAAKHTEIIVALMVIATVFMIVLPLPTLLVDGLIAFNICISSLLVVLVMYLPGPLAFSTFPTVLLLTTLFRLALSISTTRLILLEQDAGHIVEAFGNYVVSGNIAVGLVIFLIITVAQFLVIAKGSERVAEVSARFTLDAMPGKQMSIDADLRAKTIDAQTALNRREMLSKESQLFGAMDGAMKFVKGDAIAGLVIVVVNLVGGISIGVFQLDMPASQAMHLYSVLTIGDGLIAQIPALLISITAGMMITRVSTSDNPADTNVGMEVTAQLLSQPKAWIIAAVAMMGFSVLPGMPTGVFLVLAMATAAVGSYRMFRVKQQAAAKRAEQNQQHLDPEDNGDEDLRSFAQSRPYLLQFCKGVEHHPDTKRLIQDIRRLRNRLVSQFGLTLPWFHIEYSDKLEFGEFRFCVHEVPHLKNSFYPEHTVFSADDPTIPQDAKIYSGRKSWGESQWCWIETSLVSNRDIIHQPLPETTETQISSNDELETKLENSHVNPKPATAFISERMERILFATGPQFIGLQETKFLLLSLQQEQPELAQELERAIPLARLAKILQRLASERVSLRAFRTIAEALIEHTEHERDPAVLTDLVRIALRAQICYQYSGDKELTAWLLTPEMEEILRDAVRETHAGAFLALAPNVEHALMVQLKAAFEDFFHPEPVLIVAQDLRRFLRRLLEEDFHHIPVLSFSELMSTSQVRVLGRIELEPLPA